VGHDAGVWWQREKLKLEEEFNEQLQLAFGILDMDCDGMISLDELRHKLMNCGEKMSSEEVDEFMEMADEDGSGQISLDEFKKLPCWLPPGKQEIADPQRDEQAHSSATRADEPSDRSSCSQLEPQASSLTTTSI